MRDGVRIRPATDADVAGIQRVARQAWHATYDDVLGPADVDRQVSEWYDDDVVRRQIDRPSVSYLVAIDDGEVVGYASGSSANGPADTATARLDTIYVDPERWGTGIGSRLLERVADRLRDRGFRRLLISVLAANHVGRAFYERHGFVVVNRTTTRLVGEVYGELVYAGSL